MLQTELTNSPKISDVNVIISKTDKQADIVKRLEELNKWQEEQKKQLEVRQVMQRQMLDREQQNMYQMLGIQSEMSLVEDVQKGDKLQSFNDRRDEQLEEYKEEEEYVEEGLDTSQLDMEDEIYEEEDRDVDPVSYMALTAGYHSAVRRDLAQTKPKKPFLKRGEGLKQRFKIDPDELRLNNLPKYKYANAHPRLRLKPIHKFNKGKELKTNSISIANNSTKNPIKTSGPAASLDANEQRFQNLLISSKNTCSSTPDTKASYTINNISTGSKSSISGAEKVNTKKENATLPTKIPQPKSKDEAKAQPSDTKIMAWSKILDPLEIEPLKVQRKCQQSLPETEENIFELLEQKANDGSFDMDSTCLKEFMTRRITEKLNETGDNIPVQEQLKTKRLEPVTLPENANHSDSSCDEAVEEESLLTDAESSEADDTTHKTIETINSSYSLQTPQTRVRFSDSNETHEYDEHTETNTNDTSRLFGGAAHQEDQSDANKSELFTQFKQALFAALQIKADQHLSNDTSLNSVSNTTLIPKASNSVSNNCGNNNSIYSPACKELQEKTEMIKTRLAELEKEIQVFKENNVLLLKAKQDHELQKSLNAQEHLEAMESLKDERIRMEIYLHDERVKLEGEKRQFEQSLKIKTQGAVAKERKECDRLREQVTQLEMQLKSKESNHTSAQARLRTQIRNMEKEQNKLHEQIENLNRENKRLESENLKISREHNNKILLEINRNIAKLAPLKQIQRSSTSIIDEGPLTLGNGRTVSKCIVAAATANKNTGKVQKTASIRFSNVKSSADKKKPPTYKDAETSPEPSFIDERQQQQHQKHNSIDFDEDEDDVFREFQMTQEKRNYINTTNNTNISNKPSNRSLPKCPNQVPAAPPSSPRACGGYNNSNMKREIVNADGSKDIWYPNGNLKKISADGMIIRMLYYNKDIKETNINEGTVKYYYAETNTWHTTYLDGLEILEFPNGQIEHRHKNGIVEVHYPNNSIKIMDPKDEHKEEEWRFPDGTHLVQMRNGDKILSLPNGQKEIHNKLHKRREYPDGTVKIVYPDGSTETRYSNGRVRLKDKDGNLVMDTDMTK